LPSLTPRPALAPPPPPPDQPAGKSYKEKAARIRDDFIVAKEEAACETEAQAIEQTAGAKSAKRK
jgi:hypothetical protein